MFEARLARFSFYLIPNLLTRSFTYSSSKWRLHSSPFRNLTLLKTSSNSVGDFLRDLDKRALMTGDFLLVAGDVVSNISIGPVLAKHRARREKNRNAIMTMVLREAGSEHRTKSSGRRPVFVIDPELDRCVHYEEMNHREMSSRYVRLTPEMLTTHSQLDIREDLIDCYVDICTPEVLSLWSDNFDYQSVRQGFLSEVLKDYELNGKTIHTYIVADQYAARVQSLRAYDAVTKDVMSRWTYPLCPDCNLVPGQSYHFGKGKIYLEQGVKLASTSIIKSRCVFGEETSIGENSIVGDSVLGRRCHIGKDVVIDNSYIWDDVVVADGSSIRQAIVASGVEIGRNCKIERGALISFGVRIADDTTIPASSKITRGTLSEGEDIARGGHCLETDDSDAASITSSQLVYQKPSANLSQSSISTLNSDDGDDEPYHTSSRRGSLPSELSDGINTSKNRDFHLEAAASILDGLQKGDLPENILLELNSYRMAVNANPHEVRHAVVAAFIKRISTLIEGDTSSGLAAKGSEAAVKEVLCKYNVLVDRNIFDQSDQEQKPDQVDFLLLVQKEVAGKVNEESILLFVAKEAYFLELLEEDGVLQWWKDERSAADGLRSARALMEPFIRFLQEAEEESEEESEEG